MNLEDLAKIKIHQLMQEPVIVPPMATVASVIASMESNNVYEVFIEGKGKTGIVSVRDLLNAKDITATKPAAIMKYAPNLTLEASVSEAANLMTQYRLRALPILEGFKIKGQITATSIINAMKDYGVKGVKASKIMVPNPITVSAEDPVTKARSIMLRRKIDHLPVIENGRLSGIVSSWNIVTSLMPPTGMRRGAMGAESRGRLDFPVAEIADREVLKCNINDDVSTVIEMMAPGRTYTVATLWDEVQGIITQRDIIKLLAWETRPTSEIPIYMVGLPDDPFEAELAREKFSRTVALLRKSIPSIEEARSIIESKSTGGARRRYEVKVLIQTPYKTFNYTQEGWELPRIYDILADKMKRILSRKPSKRRKVSRRTFD